MGADFVKKRLKQIQAEIQTTKNKIQVDDLIKAFLYYKKQNNQESLNHLVSDQKIFSHFLVFFAGTDTTSNFFDMMIAYIGKYHHIEKKLRQQIDELMKQDAYTNQNLRKFKYVQAFQKETTRMYGPVNRLIFDKQSETTLQTIFILRKELCWDQLLFQIIILINILNNRCSLDLKDGQMDNVIVQIIMR